MDHISEGLNAALKMVFSLDREMLGIASISLKVSTVAIILATLAGIPVGFLVGIKNFTGRRLVITILNTLMAFPTVLIGLMVYSFISRQGPLGDFRLLYTPWAMIIGQAILAFPIVAALSLSAVSGIDKRVEKTAVSLGADRIQSAFLILAEGRFAIVSAVIVAFGRIFSEVGISMMLGGNIRGFTRNITTAIVLETAKGEFALGIALGMILLFVALLINILFCYLQGKNLK